MMTIMKEHDPNDDPFADLVDPQYDNENVQMAIMSPLEYGSGAISPPKKEQDDRTGSSCTTMEDTTATRTTSDSANNVHQPEEMATADVASNGVEEQIIEE